MTESWGQGEGEEKPGERRGEANDGWKNAVNQIVKREWPSDKDQYTLATDVKRVRQTHKEAQSSARGPRSYARAT